MLKRYELTNHEWEIVKDLLPPENTRKRGRPSKDIVTGGSIKKDIW